MSSTLPELDYTDLVKTGIVKYSGGGVKVSILKVTDVSNDDLDAMVKRFRYKFKAQAHLKGNLGDKSKTTNRLKWFMVETGLSMDEIEAAADYYIQECVRSNRFLMDPHHFVWKSEESRKKTLADSKLWSVYQDMKDEGDVEDITNKTTYEL